MLKKVKIRIVAAVSVILLCIAYGGYANGTIHLCIGRIADAADSHKRAFIWYTKAAEKGNMDAQGRLGEMYYKGRGVAQNHKEAFKWYTKAVDDGRWNAKGGYIHTALGLMYAKGEGVARNHDEALRRFSRRYDSYSDSQPPSFYDGIIGRRTFRSSRNTFLKDDEERIEWLERCVRRNGSDDVEAYFKLGGIYYYGEGVEQDYWEAFEWYYKGSLAVYKNYHGSEGYPIINAGRVDKTNCKQVAEFLMRQHREDTSAYHQYWIGRQYYLGQLFERDYERAIEWFTKAAIQEKRGAKLYYNSIADARFYLGRIHENGEGVVEDYTEAYKWYLLAGLIPSDTDSAKAKESLREKMTPEQIEEAQRRAKAFVAEKEASTEN